MTFICSNRDTQHARAQTARAKFEWLVDVAGRRVDRVHKESWRTYGRGRMSDVAEKLDKSLDEIAEQRKSNGKAESGYVYGCVSLDSDSNCG